MKRAWVGVIAVLLVAAAGCTESKDAYFANPCDVELVIRTAGFEPDEGSEIPPEEATAEATLAPEAVTKVEDAWETSGNTRVVSVIGGPFVSLTEDDMPKGFVALPATVCP